jgi:hypothetical protein
MVTAQAYACPEARLSVGHVLDLDFILVADVPPDRSS